MMMRPRATPDQRGAVAGSTLLATALIAVIVAGLVAIGAVLLLGGSDDPSADAGRDPSTTPSTSATEPPSDEPPTDASEDDFCEAVVAADDDIGDQIDGIVTNFDTDPVADDLAEVGTPTGADSDERAGFLLYLEVLREIDGEPTADFESDNPYDDLSPSDRADFDAYADYEADLCL